MTDLGFFEPLKQDMSEEEAVLVIKRNQSLALEWRKKAYGLQEYVRKLSGENNTK